ncbi:hypothetical protein RhiirA4_484440, partial [Rhizophagus irregularis]
MEIPIFHGVIGGDPKEWTNQVEKYLSKIGSKDDRRIFKIVKTHLLGNALQWFENEGITGTAMFENIAGKGFIRIDGEVKCKYCEKTENVTLEEINYFEVKEESEESLRNKIEMLCKEYFRKGMEYLNGHEESCEYKNMNILRMGE